MSTGDHYRIGQILETCYFLNYVRTQMKLGMCKAGTVANMYTQNEVITSIYSCSVNRDV